MAIYDEAFIDSLPPFGRFWNPMVVAICKWPGEEKDFHRLQIERWFLELPDAEKPGMKARLRSMDDSEHLSSFWELVFHQYGKEEGWVVTKNPDVGGLTPDFHIVTKHTDFYLEVASLGLSEKQRKQKASQLKVLRAIDEIRTDFAISISFKDHCDERVETEKIVERVETWLKTLPHEGVKHELAIREFGVHLKVLPRWYPKRPSLTVNGYHGPGGWIDKEPRFKKKISDKNSKYSFVKEQKKPFVIAISADELDFPETQLEWTLYGLDTISFNREDPSAEAVPGKDNSGIFTPRFGQRGGDVRNTRLSAVILCKKRWNNDQMMYDMRVFHNPWAATPLPEEVFFKMPQYVPVRDTPERFHIEWRNENKLIYFP